MATPEGIETYAGRLATFENPHYLPKRRASATKKKGTSSVSWPKTAPSPEDMARAGFWYKPISTNPDNVQCFVCRTQLDGWEPDDNPSIEHFKHSSQCGWAINVCISMGNSNESRAEEDPMCDDLLDARNATFLGQWPHEGKKGWKPKKRKMVEAGWCYDPSPEADDGTTCFYCNTSLDGWERKDDPMEEHRKRAPDCAFFELVEKYAATRPPKKGKKGRGSAASKASRLSTQSNLTVATDAPSLMSLDDVPAGEDDSILTTATNATTTSKAGKGRKGGVRARASTKSTRSTRGKGKKTSVVEATSQADVDMLDFDLGEPDAEATPEPPRGASRAKVNRDDSLMEPSSSTIPTGLKRTSRKVKAPATPEKRLSDDQAQLHAEMQAAIEASLHSEDGTPKPKRGTKRTSNGTPKDESSAVALDGPREEQPAPAEKPKRARKGKMAAANTSELRSSAGLAAAQPKPTGRTRAGSKSTRAKNNATQELEATQDVDTLAQEPPGPEGASPPASALPAHTPSPPQASSASPPPPTPTPARIAATSAHRSSPVRPRLSMASERLERTPSASPKSDAENKPPSSRPQGSARLPLASVSPNKRVLVAASTPTASPSKRKAPGGLKSTFPWDPTDLETVFIPSPSSKTVGRSSGFGFGNATNLTQQEKENLAALDKFAVDSEKAGKPKLDEVVKRVKGALTSPEKKMTVEDWVYYNAKRGEERLRGECERLVGLFEKEGGRALQALEGLDCAN